ncbi:DUF5710 domain-containing protein [Uliginosibacterium sp. TH139]|uniref:DUF5710 domain-containing protein n=1 Tax=Uliginosibacterium sp. TH139 TaxID=2067453 RepID=UPI000C7C5D45|nr:DUF5710 domain-containing protein [Uliginosibacterium sp. TH139]PLK48188.1 hypothetical protein C0V76_13220 [Uliginosibacterium sp. TH139]
MRFDLKVPFAEKDAAKKLGARWDAANKLWYVMDKEDMAPFAKWSPSPRDAASATAPQNRAPSKSQMETSGKLHVGSQYVERPRVCECLPWEDCATCREASV